MEKIKKTNVELLCERIEQNYNDYKKEMDGVGIDYIMLFASELAAVDEVHTNIIYTDEGNGYVTESDAALLLESKNPLKMLAGEWQYYKLYKSCDFGKFIDDFIKDIDTDECQPEIVEEELRGKYGDDMPLNTAALLEIVELLREFINPSDDDFEIFDFDGEGGI